MFKRGKCAMANEKLQKKHFNIIIRVLAAVALSALMAAFILAFRANLLPYAEDGNAFDTVYAYEENTAE